MSDPIAEILSPEMQEAFWGALDPDIRAYLTAFEAKEGWTYHFEEMPELFIEVARALPGVVDLPLTPQTQQLLRDLIPLLAAMPLRQAVAAIVWLDNRAARQPQAIGWGVVIYREVAWITFEAPEDPLYAEARTLFERIRVLMQSRVATALFCQLKEEL